MRAPRKKKVRPLSRSAVRRHFKPYAIEIGQVTLAWNGLHQNLCVFFWFALGAGHIPSIIWNKLSNDRIQRDILRVVIEAGGIDARDRRLTADLLWLLDEADKLAETRNIAVHAPLTILTDLETGTARVEPAAFWGNKRAKSLKGKNIAQEFLWCAECTDILLRFAASLLRASPGSASWPERPSLPPPPSCNPAQTKR